MINTYHQTYDREEREALINWIMGKGNIIDSFIVDKGHKNGTEIHNIADTGIIIIQNQRTEKLVTMLIARPQQIKRYYEAENRDAPEWLINLAYEHYLKGYNKI